MYPQEIVLPMKAELTDKGFRQLETPEAVDAELSSQSGTTFVVFNSVCGCA
ncbi:MAG: BrxA/BrxB family bacilliredoxin, partial [Bacteroidota bacterium]|nr:BrxA/BrxB family bacilliredoxin [Bacteroidota bacterium]